MDRRQFNHYMAGWLNPQTILHAASRFKTERAAAESRSSMLLGSAILIQPTEAAFIEIIDEYLSGFSVPPALITLLRTQSSADDAAWKWIERLRFRGRLDTHFQLNDTDRTRVADFHPLVSVVAQDVVIDLTLQPLSMLNDVISFCAQTWKGMTQAVEPSQLHYVPATDSAFATYVEAKVAKAYGVKNPGRSGLLVSSSESPVLRYRAPVMQVIRPPVDPRFIQVMKDGAYEQAKETQQPLS